MRCNIFSVGLNVMVVCGICWISHGYFNTATVTLYELHTGKDYLNHPNTDT